MVQGRAINMRSAFQFGDPLAPYREYYIRESALKRSATARRKSPPVIPSKCIRHTYLTVTIKGSTSGSKRTSLLRQFARKAKDLLEPTLDTALGSDRVEQPDSILESAALDILRYFNPESRAYESQDVERFQQNFKNIIKTYTLHLQPDLLRTTIQAVKHDFSSEDDGGRDSWDEFLPYVKLFESQEKLPCLRDLFLTNWAYAIYYIKQLLPDPKLDPRDERFSPSSPTSSREDSPTKSSGSKTPPSPGPNATPASSSGSNTPPMRRIPVNTPAPPNFVTGLYKYRAAATLLALGVELHPPHDQISPDVINVLRYQVLRDVTVPVVEQLQNFLLDIHNKEYNHPSSRLDRESTAKLVNWLEDLWTSFDIAWRMSYCPHLTQRILPQRGIDELMCKDVLLGDLRQDWEHTFSDTSADSPTRHWAWYRGYVRDRLKSQPVDYTDIGTQSHADILQYPSYWRLPHYTEKQETPLVEGEKTKTRDLVPQISLLRRALYADDQDANGEYNETQGGGAVSYYLRTDGQDFEFQSWGKMESWERQSGLKEPHQRGYKIKPKEKYPRQRRAS